ncbi:MAG TPA: glycerol kinase GlpK [Candidatus Tectomicrobia bacterium]|nr:glycerol kinase GlpK [Candidatus Tectomicrobia bacterium]
MAGYTLALDQGTTSSRAIVFDPEGNAVAQSSQTLRQIYPAPGWVEHDPREIWHSQRLTAEQAVHQAGIAAQDIRAIGIANQRETTLLWERSSGRPVYNAIVWQCRRSAPQCERLLAQGLSLEVRARTGLVIDAYFSATKLQWLFEQDPGLRRRANRGELCFGTVDSWLVYRMTGGRLHITDASNAARTMLYNIHTGTWDPMLLEALQIPHEILPVVCPSSYVYGLTEPSAFLGSALPIAGMVGDQQAALFGQACFSPAMAKQTYGTGGFLLLHTGTTPVPSRHGLLTTVAWDLGVRTDYALEGSVFIAGAVIQWLRDGLRLIASAKASEAIAAEVSDTNGVYFVPAFVGLGAPYWDPHARGTIVGLTGGVNRSHLVRAALEAIAYQTRDVLEAMQQDAGIRVPEMRVDGGAAANTLLLQFQADILGIPLARAKSVETTARGAAFLAGLATGMWSSLADIAAQWQGEARYTPRMSAERREELYAGWRRAVERAKTWASP